MKLYHQTGFRWQWNLEKLVKNNAGDGLIISPKDIHPKNLATIPETVLHNSFLDPQLFRPSDSKGNLKHYPFFPAEMLMDVNTSAISRSAFELANRCLEFQTNLNFEYIIIPARHYEPNPDVWVKLANEQFVKPYIESNYLDDSKKFLLTLFLKHTDLVDQSKYDYILDWVTGLNRISGVYLIFENNFTSKQIRDADFLFNALKTIHILRKNELEVHIGYANLEGFLYSVAEPSSVSMGIYENLRKFTISRFTTHEKSNQFSPNPKIYFPALFQWIEHGYLIPLKRNFDIQNFSLKKTEELNTMMKNGYIWQAGKSEPYKDYLIQFSEQISLLNQAPKLIEYVRSEIHRAINLYKLIESKVVLEDQYSGSHLYHWLNALNLYEEYVNN